MTAVALILILLAATAGLDVVAGWLGVPHPVLLVIGGLLLALTPGLPRPQLVPDVVFLVFVPPLIYRAALTTSWRDFRTNLRAILLLAVGLVIATMVVVAAVAHQIEPALSWSAAFVLGAIVSPPDPIAATAVSRHLDTPRDVDTVLKGEGLVNDATAFVAYRMAVDATTSGHFTWETAAIRFVVAAVGGLAVGVAVAVFIAWLRRRLDVRPEVENTISLLTPFAAFIPAERLGFSGVLAVVAVGLYLGREGARIVSPETRVQGAGMWGMTTFVLEGLIFILIGLDLPLVVSGLPQGRLVRFALYGLVISAAAIAIRLAWMFADAFLFRRLSEWRGRKRPSWRHVFFVGWAGMRGADSLVIALALPLTTLAGMPFPGRPLIIVVTFVVILITLVMQGLTLNPMIRWLGLHDDGSEERENDLARLRIAKAGLAELDELISTRSPLSAAARELRADHRHRVHRYDNSSRRDRHVRDEDAAYAEARREARNRMIAAERGELVRLRDDGAIGDDVLREIQRELDLEQMLAGGGDDTLEDSEQPVRRTS